LAKERKMGEKSSGTDLESIGTLRKSIHSYALWEENMQKVMGSDPKFNRVVAWAILGKDGISEGSAIGDSIV
jgi:hypothetical protein